MGLQSRASKTGKNNVSAKNTVSGKTAHAKPASESPAMGYMPDLQRTIGNQAMGRLLQSGVLQTKLKIGPANDKYEQEADRIADRVVSISDSAIGPEPRAGKPSIGNPASQIARTPLVHSIMSLQRTCASCQKEYNQASLQRRPVVAGNLCPTCRSTGSQFIQQKQNNLQRKENPVAPSIETSIDSARGQGRPLSAGERSYFEPRFGADFGGVKVHTDSRAEHLSRSVNARAFTVGSDIFFGAGQYSPHTGDGKRLMAHELTHTVQQGGAPAIARKPAGKVRPGKISQLLQLSRLRDYRSRPQATLSDNVFVDTNEYKAYRNTNLVWQTSLGVSENEALYATRLILHHLNQGRKVNWRMRARYYALKAREVLSQPRPECPVGTAGAPQLRNPHIASGSLCRGACGADCEPNNCAEESDITVNHPSDTGEHYYVCNYPNVVNCGSHQGCREHDACYDRVTSAWGRRGCDMDCISDYSLSECNSWRTGGGPFDSHIKFSDPGVIIRGPIPK